MRAIAPAALHARLIEQAGELALLDVREGGPFARGHILLASHCPRSRLEIEAPRLVPRRGAPVVLCDDGDGLAERAAACLAGFGYHNLTVLNGGVPAWRDAGLALFDGVYVPSKAFGEFVETIYRTPHIAARELAQLRAGGRALVVLDSRPMSEYRRMSIPGGIDVPGAELVHRVADLAPDPATLVVVNCAGRTRSIIGAQSLINAGIPNRVVALENGTIGWTLAGLELEHGQTRTPPPLSEPGRRRARDAAARVAARFDVRFIDREMLASWRVQADERTLYVCDVRSPEEYEAGHLPGALCTPGGQLVQATDSYLGTHGARVVLVDDDGVRATMTASWLVQIGRWEICALQGGLGDDLETGLQHTEVLGLDDDGAVAAIDVQSLARLAPGRDVQVLDFADSAAYRAGHIPGAWFVRRRRLEEDLAQIPSAPDWVLTSDDGILARLAAAEVASVVAGSVRVLTGGTEAWRAAGRMLEEGGRRMPDEPDDVYLRPYDRAPEQIEQAMHDYLSWETGLVPRIARDGTLRFRLYPNATLSPGSPVGQGR